MNDLKSQRQSKNLSLEQLAAICQTNITTIHRLENGLHFPRKEMKLKIERVLGSIDWGEVIGLDLPSNMDDPDHFILSYLFNYVKEDPERRLQFLNNILKQIKNKNHERITVLHD